MKLKTPTTETLNLLHRLYGENRRITYSAETMILVDASKPGRLVSGCEASDNNYFGVG